VQLKGKKVILLVSLVAMALLALVASCQPITSNSALESSSTTPAQEMTEVNIADYRLAVDGLVANPLTLTYESLLSYPAVTEMEPLVCPGFFEEDKEWTGVPVSTLLTEAGIKPEASQVTFIASDGYQVTLSLSDVQQNGDFLAYKADGQVLNYTDGYPLRLVAKSMDGNKWVRWLYHIKVS
jgi:sulfane dehydrogenase subunit SoxC